MKIGFHIRDRRRAINECRSNVAIVARMDPFRLRRIEEGLATPTLLEAVALADTFGLSLDELIGRTVPPPRSFAGTGRLTGESSRRSA